jgi:hypothetical protein
MCLMFEESNRLTPTYNPGHFVIKIRLAWEVYHTIFLRLRSYSRNLTFKVTFLSPRFVILKELHSSLLEWLIVNKFVALNSNVGILLGFDLLSQPFSAR